MSTKYTPGPWDLLTGRGSGPNGAQILCGGVKIAGMATSANMPLDEKWANARLIAAAPELLAQLKKSRQTLWECAQDTIGTPTEPLFRKEVADCDEVIANAEGVDPANDPASADDTSQDAKAKKGD